MTNLTKIASLPGSGQDDFMQSLPALLRNGLRSVSLNTEQQIRDSFSRDGGLSISETPNLGAGMMLKLQRALKDAYEAREFTRYPDLLDTLTNRISGPWAPDARELADRIAKLMKLSNRNA